MEGEPVGELLYETRRHASGPYTSNYPPLPSKANERSGGGFLSLLSARGISQLKAKWSNYKHPTKVKKTISLFVSPYGEFVAVAAANQITILRKDDDYQEPHGIFTSGSPVTFVYGVWSETHGVLAVTDEADTIYFIKANGEEIMRTTNRQLKLSSPILGLGSQSSADVQESYLCSFIILTADGFLHHLENGQKPIASISLHSSNINSTTKRQFPRDVFCCDYDAENFFLVVVGRGISLSQTSTASPGSCHLSLWRRFRNFDMEPLCSIQFEGSYCEPKDYEGHLAYPKVLISPQCSFVATLDVTGCLHIFRLDKQSCLLFRFDGEGRTSNVINGQEIVDFTWWSDHILTIAKMGGIVTMFDILTGVKLQKDDPVYCLPVLDRVWQLEGKIFLLESKSSEERKILFNHSRESSDSHQIEQITEDRCNQFDLSRFRWNLISMSQKSVPEMYTILINNQQYEAALDFAYHHGLDSDEVLKSQWLHSGQGINEITMFLSNVKDQGFVLSQCVDKVGPTEDVVKALLAHGLQLTDQFRFQKSDEDECSQIWDFRMARLQLLQFRDRLETYVGINMGRFSAQEYSNFRVISLHEAAMALAEGGKIGALNLLFKRHPYSLSPFMLDILAAIPETISVQTYLQLLPGRSPPTSIAIREEDWVECEQMVSFINQFPENNEISVQSRTEPIVKLCLGYPWPSASELSTWYKKRARDIDCCSGQLDNCLCLVDFACRKGFSELQQFHEDILYLHHLIYDEADGEMFFNVSLVNWEQLSDFEKFRMMLKEVKEENVIKKLHDNAIPLMQNRFREITVSEDHESFLVRWLKEIALENKLDICLMVIEEGCRELQSNDFFKDESEAVDCALQCIYMSTVTDRWSTMAAILSKLPQKQDAEAYTEGLMKKLKLAEGHIEAGRLLAFYQVPKPINFFKEAYEDEKGVKQILRLILSKFVRRQPGRSDNDWANLWRDMQCLQEKAFSFLDPDYMLMEFCRGLLKAGKFSLARNYLKGTGSVALASDKAENLVIQAAREYFFSASSLSCSEIWKARECLNLFPSSRTVKAEVDVIDALTVKLPNLGVSLLPMQFRQIKDPMEIIKMAISTQAGAYLHVDELIDVAKLLGLSSSDDISAVKETIAREAAVAGDLQLAFDLCLALARKGHGPIWDLCAAIARGPALENMDINSRKQLLGFAVSHCDEESIGELLNAWKDLDMQGQCEMLLISTGANSFNFSVQGSSIASLSIHDMQDIEGVSSDDQEVHFCNIKNTLSFLAKSLPIEGGKDLESLLREHGKLSFVAFQLPWLHELSGKEENGKKWISDSIRGKHYVSIQTQALLTILSWLARKSFAPRDNVVASLAKSIMESPVTEEEDIIGCSFLLNLGDAFSGVEVIEDLLRVRKNYREICSIMNVGMTYSSLHNDGVDCKGPAQRRELLLRKFKEKQTSLSSDEIHKIDENQSTFWKEWKLKLEEKKRAAEQTRVLEQIIPGADTARILSADFDYIETEVFKLIESLKMEKKQILEDVLKVVDTYGINRMKVLQQYLISILVSEVWTTDDIATEISEVKGELIGSASETIKVMSLVVYPAIHGCNKQRLAFIFSLLSDCYLQLEETKESLPIRQPSSSYSSTLDLAHFYKVIEQECHRVSFIKNLNFKNIAGLDGLNLQAFRNEVYLHIDEFSLEALANMVQKLTSLYTDSVPEGLLLWQDVYKHFILNSLTTLESRVRTDLDTEKPEMFQEFISHLERNYDFCRIYVRLLAPPDALIIVKKYLMVIMPMHDTYGSIPDNSTWQDCIIILLNFWLRLVEDMREIASGESLVEKFRFDPECLSSCLKVLVRLVMEDTVSPSQSWGTIVGYISNGLIGDFSGELLIFCKAMVLSGCGFGAISEVFLEALSHSAASLTPASETQFQDLAHLYINMVEPILTQLVSGSYDYQNLNHLLSSLSKLEGRIEDLQKVRRIVWERIAQFSNNLQLPSHVRVYVLEVMQLITGRNIKGFSAGQQFYILPWQGWDELLCTSNMSEAATNYGLPDPTDTSSRLTSTLVALKSSQLAVAISSSIEITTDDLLNVETAVSCFLKLCEASSTDPHFGALLAILEEWEGYFVTGEHEVKSAEVSEAENDWNNDEWDEGWESFQEVEPIERLKDSNDFLVHPLHACWMAIFKRLFLLSRFSDVLRMIDQSLPKSKGALLDEDGVASLSRSVSEVDCFLALKLALLLPYESVQLQCLGIVEDKLKQGSIPDMVGKDHEFLLLVLSSGLASIIITKSSYDATLSYLCYLVGSFTNRCLAAESSKITQSKANEHINKEVDLLLFGRIIFPCFVSELVKADQLILAGFLVTKFMRANPSLSLINVAEASLRRYLESQLAALQQEEPADEGMCSAEILKNTVFRLRCNLRNLITSALALLSTNTR